MAIYINTNQNVRINYELSSIGERILAYIIDSLVIAGIAIGVIIVGSWLDFGFGIFLFLATISLYHLICEITMNGQSVGKRQRGIRVMKKDGTAATFSSYFLRFLLRPIDSIYGLGLAIIFFTSKNQRLGDLAAGTIVVNVKTEDELKQQIRQEMHLDSKDEIKYPRAGELSDKEIQIITSVLRNRFEYKEHDNVVQLAEKIAEKIDAKYDDISAYYFLKRVVQDYYKTHSN